MNNVLYYQELQAPVPVRTLQFFRNMALAPSQRVIFVAFSTSSLSVVSCTSVISSIYWDPRSTKSYHLQLVQRLLISNLFLSMLFIFYYILQETLVTSSLKMACNFLLPAIVFFFIASYVSGFSYIG